MRIVCLLENTQGNPQCEFEHGLSLYIETDTHRILSDAGQSDAAIHNAAVLGIDLTKLDSVFLSHGHYDHSGALISLSEIAPNARIYMQAGALDKHVHGERDIGIDPRIASLSNLRLLNGNLRIDGALSVFSGVRGHRLDPVGNKGISRILDSECVPDDFAHEQSLVIRDGGRNYLFSGCAHRGILNILDRYREIYGDDPYMAVTGFHMKKDAPYTELELASIRETALELKNTNTIFVTGHCTGDAAFAVMKEIMEDQLRRMRSGEEIMPF